MNPVEGTKKGRERQKNNISISIKKGLDAKHYQMWGIEEKLNKKKMKTLRISTLRFAWNHHQVEKTLESINIADTQEFI